MSCVLASSGCDSVPAPGGLTGWNVGDTVQVGDCAGRLLHAAYYHSSSWNLEVTVELTNVGYEAKRCGFEAQLISGSNVAITKSVGEAKTYVPEESAEIPFVAGEKDLTGFSGGPSGGDWVLLTVVEGQPFIGDKEQFHATPERIRPPS